MRSFTLFLREVLFSARLKTKDQGVCCVFIDFRNLPAVADALQMAGWIWRGIAVWDKKSSDNMIPRGSWLSLEVRPDDLAYISIDLIVQGFIQSRGDKTV